MRGITFGVIVIYSDLSKNKSPKFRRKESSKLQNDFIVVREIWIALNFLCLAWDNNFPGNQSSPS